LLNTLTVGADHQLVGDAEVVVGLRHLRRCRGAQSVALQRLTHRKHKRTAVPALHLQVVIIDPDDGVNVTSAIVADTLVVVDPVAIDVSTPLTA
jgi:hypothetical protein